MSAPFLQDPGIARRVCQNVFRKIFLPAFFLFLSALVSIFSLRVEPAFAQIGQLGQTFEFDGGETVFSQNSQYYFAMLGDFVSFRTQAASGRPAPDVGTAALSEPSLHLFLLASSFAYETPGPGGTTVNAYNGISPAAGVRIPLGDGFWEGDVGVAVANALATGTPVETVAGVYLQSEYYRLLGPGALDLFANFTGYISYLYGQARWLVPAWKARGLSDLFLGPELIGQGNNSYNAQQGGAAIGLALPRIHSYLTLDGGLLRSSVSSGWGGYQGFSWYVSY